MAELEEQLRDQREQLRAAQSQRETGDTRAWTAAVMAQERLPAQIEAIGREWTLASLHYLRAVREAALAEYHRLETESAPAAQELLTAKKKLGRDETYEEPAARQDRTQTRTEVRTLFLGLQPAWERQQAALLVMGVCDAAAEARFRAHLVPPRDERRAVELFSWEDAAQTAGRRIGREVQAVPAVCLAA